MCQTTIYWHYIWFIGTDDSQNYRDATLWWYTAKTEYGFHFKQEPHMAQVAAIICTRECRNSISTLYTYFSSPLILSTKWTGVGCWLFKGSLEPRTSVPIHQTHSEEQGQGLQCQSTRHTQKSRAEVKQCDKDGGERQPSSWSSKTGIQTSGKTENCRWT